MKHAKIVMWSFVIVASLQLLVPLSMIAGRNATLRKGAPFKFQTRPVDPYNPFQGRYVALSFVSDHVLVDKADDYERGQIVYVTIGEGTNGFANLTSIASERPIEGDYLKTRVRYHSSSTNVYVNLPFDRFYMNEDAAPQAEIQFRRGGNREQRRAYALVRIHRGKAVLDDLYIEDLPVLEFLKQTPPETP